MNKVFQLVWNHFSRTWVAAGETAKRNTKGRYAVDGILAALAALGVGISSAKPKAKNSQAFGLSCMTVALAMAQGGMVYAATPAPTALPTGAQIAAGQANIVQQDNTLIVQQQTDKLITNWQSFNIGNQATVNFQQPNSDSVALNRITNQDPTQILGNLNANGQIFLLNPAGIIIGNEAQVNVNTLVATTLSMTDQDFLDENYALTGDPNSLAKIVNQGTITTPEGGRVALIAPVVENQGDIITPDGTTALAAASEVELDLSGQGTLGIRIDKGTLNALVENQQLIQANNGQVILTARAVDALTKSVVNNDGIIEATSLTSKGGRIVLEGDDINLGSNTTIDASGETGGGEILIGGDWQGTGDMQQAETVTMDAGAEIHADAITQGDGGKVVLWSDIHNTNSLTEVHGEITARGGSQSGDGGQIETSGAHLNTDGIDINAGSVTGESGEWLIDPYDYTVDSTAAANIANALNNSTNVTLTTASNVASYGSNGNSGSAGNVTISSAITATTGNADFAINAVGSVYINANITTYGDVYIKTEDAIDQSGGTTITTNGGNVVYWSNSDGTYNDADYIRTGAINTDGGHVWIGGSWSNTAAHIWNGLQVGAGYAIASTLDAVALRNNIDTRSGGNNAIGGDVWIAGESGLGNGADVGSEGAVRKVSAGNGDITIVPHSMVLQNSSNYQTDYSTSGQISIIPANGKDWWSGVGVINFDGVMNSTWFEGSQEFDGFHVENFANIGGLNIGTYPGTGIQGDTAYTSANTQVIHINEPISIKGSVRVYGRQLNIYDNITTTADGSGIYFTNSATGNGIIDGYVATVSGADLTTNNGDIILWTNTQGLTSGQANSEIIIGTGSTLSSTGGKIVLAGGADDGANGGVAGDSIPDHYAYRGEYNGAGVDIRGGAVIDSDGGNIIMRGHGVGAGNPYGIQTAGNLRIESGTGTITIDGSASTNHGIYFNANLAINSNSDAATAISITGTTTSTSAYGIHMGSSAANSNLLIQSTAAIANTGDIVISGISPSSTHGLTFDFYGSDSEMEILTAAGDITITSDGSIYNASNLYLGQRYNTTAINSITPLATKSTGNISISAASSMQSYGSLTINTGDSTNSGGNVIIATDSDANNGGNIITNDVTINTYRGNITLGGGNTSGTSFAIGTDASTSSTSVGIWLQGDVDFNSAGGDISIKGKSIASGYADVYQAAWGVGLGFSGTAYNTDVAKNVTINSGTGTIYIEGHGQSDASLHSSPFGVVFNNWEGATSAGSLNITSANTTANAIRLIGDTTNTNSGQRQKSGLVFWSSDSHIRATGTDGAITLSATSYTGNGHNLILWQGGDILATSGDITISTNTEGVQIDGSLYLGARAGITGNTSSSSDITITSHHISVATDATITTSGDVVIQPIGDDYVAAVSITGLTVDANSLTLGKVNKAADGTNDVDLTLASASITTANALTFAGKNISFSGSATTTAANTDIKILASGYITNAALSTITTGSSTVTGGNVILASNVDDATDNDTTTNGYINMRQGIVINTHGGDITIGGGDTNASGYAYGSNNHNGTSYNYTEGVRFDSTFSLDSAGGDVAIRGKSYPVTVTSSYGAAAIGLYSLGANSKIDSGTGTISITGYGQTSGSSYSSGIVTHSSTGHGLTITSANTTANAITLKGISTGTSGDAWGMEFNTDLSVTATGTGGGINILTAQKNTTYNFDIVYRGTTDILAKSGPINLKGGQTLENVNGIANGKFYKEGDIFIGSKASSAVTTSSSNLTMEYDTHNWNGGAKPAVATTGDILWQPANSTFGQYTATSWFTWDANGHKANSLIVGKASNTSDILIGENLTTAGDITIYGADINQQGNLDTSAGNGDITLYASDTFMGGHTGNRTIKSGTGNISIYAESPLFDGGSNYNTTFTSTGHFTLAPYEVALDGFDPFATQIEFQGTVTSGKFTGSGDINGLDINNVASLTGFTLGKDGNYHATSTQGYYVYVDAGTTLSINGPINIYGKYVSLGDGIASTASGADVLLKATDYIQVGPDSDVTTNGGDIIFWADSDASGAGRINLSDAGSGITLSTDGGDIIMGGGNATNGLPGGFAEGGSAFGIDFNSVTASGTALTILDTRKTGSTAGNVSLYGNSTSDDGIYLRNTKIYAHDLTINGETDANSDYGVSLWANAVASTLFDIDNDLTITATNNNGTSSTDYSLRTGANPRIYADGDISLISTGYLNYNSNQTDLEIKSGKTFTINAVNGTGAFTTPLIGAGSLYKDGTGTVTLSGSTNYSGDTTVNKGTLEVTGTLSDTGNVNVLANGTLELSNTDTIGSIEGAGNITLNTGDTLTVGNSLNKTFSGVISGAGNFVKQGTGQLTLSGTNTYTGYTTVNVGTLLVSGTLSNGTALTVANSATYKLGASGTVGSITGAGDIQLASFVLTTGGDNISTTFDGLLSGTGGLTKAGTGTLTLTKDQTYTGSTTISAGTLQLGNGGTTGSVSGNIINNGVLTFSYSDDQAVNNAISGTGAINIPSSYSGVLSSTLLSTPVTIATNAVVSEVLERIAGGALGGGAINSGTQSEGTVVLKTYDASTNTATFQVQLIDGGLLKAVFVKIQQNGNNVEAILDTSTFASGAAYLSSGPIGTDVSTGTAFNYQLDQLDVSTKITLTGANSYTGTTTVSANTETGNTGSISYTKTINSALQIGTGGTTGGSGGSAIVNNGIVIFNRSDNLTVNGAISGSGAITKVGSNTLTLTGNATHTGNTYIGGGTLVIEDDTQNLATDFYGPGSLTVQSAGNSFTSAFSSSSISYTDIGGLTIGKSTNTADITFGDATINGAINAYGGNITVSGNLDTSSAGNTGDVLLKTSGDLTLAANKSITTNGGDVILWSNSDNFGDNGYILMRDGSSITTSSGHLWMGGGSGTSTWNSLIVGDGYAKAGGLINSATFIGSSDGGVQSGIYLENASINTTGGHVAMYGEGDDSGERGILSIGDFTLNAGAGKILLDAKSNNEISLIFGHHSVNTSSEAVSLTTSNAAADAISITTTSTNIGTGWSYGTWVEGTANLLATNGGGISLTTAGVANGINLGYSNSAGTLNMFSSSGDITLNTGSNGINIRTAGSSINLGRGGSTVTTSASDLTIIADDFSSNGSLAFNTSGTLTIKPQANNSFTSTFDTSNLTYSNDVSGLTIGHANNTGNITIGSSTAIAGDVTLYGGNIAIDNALTLTNSGTLAITASGTITDGANGAITAPKLAINGATSVILDHANNDFDTIAATSVGAFTIVDKDDLAVDAVNPTGITATGDVSLSADGTLTINEGISIGSNNLTLKADDFTFTTNLSGSGNLMLSPVDGGVAMGVGSATATWQVTSANLTKLSDGFSQITIGSTAGGNLTVDGYNSWADNLVLQAGSSANLTVADDLTWSQAESLTLKAGNNIYINGTLTASNNAAALNVYYGGSDSSTVPSAGTTYELDLSDYSTIDMTGTTPSLRVGNDSYTFIDSMSDFAGMSATGTYALSQNLTAPSSVYSGSVYTSNFTGKLDGLGHTIANLKVAGNSGNVGLFSTVQNATIRHLGITNANMESNFTGHLSIGSLIGKVIDNNASSSTQTTTLQGIWSSGVVKTDAVQASNSGYVLAMGGLVGAFSGQGTLEMSRAFSTTTVSAAGSYPDKLAMGGVIGDVSYNQSSSSNSIRFNLDRAWATGSVVSGNHGGYYGTGGIAGVIYTTSSANSSMTDIYSWGNASSNSSTSVGGLYGFAITMVSQGYTTQAPYSGSKKGGNNGTESNIYASITDTAGTSLPSGFSSAQWSKENNGKPYLSSLPIPARPIYVDVNNGSFTYGSVAPTYTLVNSSGSAISLGSGIYANVTAPSGTASYSMATDANVGTYSDVSYLSGLSLGGSDAAKFILYPYSDAASISVTQKTLTASGLTVPNKTYDGNTTGTLSAGNLTGIINGDAVTLNGSATFASADAATGISVSISGLSLAGSDASNYSLNTSSASTTADIIPATLSISGTSIADKIYDGTTVATATAGIVSGYIGSETLTISASASFTSANVGNQTLTASYTLANGSNGGKADNYTLADTTGISAAINKRNLTVTATDQSKTYGDTLTLSTSSFTSSGLQNSETIGSVTLAAANSYDSSTTVDANTYSNEIGISAATGGTFAASNYNITYVAGDLTVNPKAISYTPSASNKVYDGNDDATLTTTITGIINGDTVSVTPNGNFASANVGAGQTITETAATISGADAGNYTFTSTAPSLTANITQLSSVAWTGGATGNWHDASNWAGGAVPSLSNVATVSIPSGTTVTFDPAGASAGVSAGAVSVDGVSGAGSLTITGGDLTVGSSHLALTGLTQSAGSLTSDGNVSVDNYNYSGGTQDLNGNLTVSTDFVQNAAISAVGNIAITNADITINNDITVTGSGNSIVLKTPGNLDVAANSDLTTNGGAVVLWSNTDGGTSNAHIALRGNSSITTNGGHLWLGGSSTNNGSTTWSGLTVGDGYSVGGTTISAPANHKLGLLLENTTIDTDGGNIRIAGDSASGGAAGIATLGTVSIDSGTGTIVLDGKQTGGNFSGIEFGFHDSTINSSLTITSAAVGSSSSTVTAISITGSSNGSLAGVSFNGNTEISATGTGTYAGGINISGTASNNAGIKTGGYYDGVTKVLSKAGAITLDGGASGVTVDNGTNRTTGTVLTSELILGSESGHASVASSSADISLIGDTLTTNANGMDIRTSGEVAITSSGSSFTSALSTDSISLSSDVSGLTLGKTTNTSNITLGEVTSISGDVAMYGADITIAQNLNTSAASGAKVLAKATGDIVLATNKSITTDGGDVIFWADSDASGSLAYIELDDGYSITTGGGDIVLAGGLDDGANGGTVNDGIPDGYAAGKIESDTSSNIYAGIFSNDGTMDTRVSGTLDANAGNILMRGKGTQTNGSVTHGVQLWNTKIYTNEFEAKGTVTSTAASNKYYGVAANGAVSPNNTVLRAYGDITLTGDMPTPTSQWAVRWGTNHEMYTTAGSVNINAIGQLLYLSSQTLTFAAGEALVFDTDYSAEWRNTIAGAGGIVKKGSGTLELSKASTFTGPVSLEGGTLEVSHNTGLGAGTSAVSVANGTTLELHGVSVSKAMNLNGGLVKAATGTNSITGDISLGANTTFNVSGTKLTLGGVISGANNVTKTGNGTLVMTNDNTYTGSTTISAGAFEVGTGNLGSLDTSSLINNGSSVKYLVGQATTIDYPISGSGTVSITTTSGNITLADNISTTNTGTSAIVVNAGKNTAAGTATGGNIIISGTPSLTTGTGGSTTLYTGSISGSTGLTSHIGSGSGNFRYNSDESSTGYTTAISSGTYAIYREQPLVSYTANDASMTYGGSTPALTQTLTGTLQNGDTPNSATPVITGAATSTSGNYQAGTWNIVPQAGNLADLGYGLNATNGTLTVAKKTLSVSYAGSDRVYDATTTATVTDTITGTISNDVVSISETAAFIDKHIGNGKTINVSNMALAGADAGNYALAATSTTTTADITAKTITISYTGSYKVYDGNTLATVASSGWVSGDAVSTSETALFADKNKANGKTINVSNISLSGADANNYTLANSTATTSADITARTVTLNGATGISKTYDGLTSMPVGQNGYGSLVNAVAGDDLNVSGVPVFNTANAGNNTIVQNTVALAGTDASNYSLNWVDGSGTINKAALTITANNDAKFVTQSDVSNFAGASYSGFVNSETSADLTGTLSVTRSNSSQQLAGTYANVLEASGLSSNNYHITYVKGDYDIVAANQLLVKVNDAVSTYGTNQTYVISSAKYMNGSNSIIDLTSNVTATNNGIVISDGVGGSASFTLVAGSATTSTAGFVETGNYSIAADNVSTASNNFSNTLTITGNHTVNKKPLSIAYGATNKVYDATNSVTVTETLTGVVAGDVISISESASFADKNAANGKAVTINNITMAGTDAGNYQISTSFTPVTADITQKALSFNYSASDKVYDANSSVNVNANLTGVISGDSVNISETASFSDQNAASNKTVSISNVQITGTDAGNYSLPATTDSTTASITKKLLSLAYAGVNKVYDALTGASVVDSLTGMINGDNVSVSESASFADKNVSNGKTVSISNIALNGTEAGNYRLANTSMTTTADITAKPLTLNYVATDKTYDGNTNVTVTDTLGGVISGDSLQLSETAAFVSDQAGTGHNVNITSVAISGTDAGNYSLPFNSTVVTADINQRTVNLSGNSNVSKVYDGTTVMPSSNVGYGSLSNVVTGDNLSISGSPVYASANVGSHAINLGSVALAGSDAANYTLNWTDGSGSISKAALTVTANDDAKFVTQSDVANFAGVSFSGFVNGETVTDLGGTLAISRSNSSVQSAGNYTGVLSASGYTSGNYQISYVAGDYTIVPANELLVRVTDVSSIYGSNQTYQVASAKYMDGANTIQDLSSNISASGNAISLTDGAGGSTSFTLAPVNASNSSSGYLEAGTYSIDAGSINNTSANFNNSLFVVGTHIVNQKPLSISYVGSNKIYDGTTAAAVTETLTGGVSGDTLTISESASFASQNVGTGISVNISAITLAGTDAANYALNTSHAPVTADISTRAVTVTADDQEKNIGRTDPAFTYTTNTATSTTGLVSGETLTGTLTRVAGELVGDYAIQQGTLTNANNTNYSITYVAGKLEVKANNLVPNLPAAPTVPTTSTGGSSLGGSFGGTTTAGTTTGGSTTGGTTTGGTTTGGTTTGGTTTGGTTTGGSTSGGSTSGGSTTGGSTSGGSTTGGSTSGGSTSGGSTSGGSTSGGSTSGGSTTGGSTSGGSTSGGSTSGGSTSGGSTSGGSTSGDSASGGSSSGGSSSGGSSSGGSSSGGSTSGGSTSGGSTSGGSGSGDSGSGNSGSGDSGTGDSGSSGSGSGDSGSGDSGSGDSGSGDSGSGDSGSGDSGSDGSNKSANDSNESGSDRRSDPNSNASNRTTTVTQSGNTVIIQKNGKRLIDKKKVDSALTTDGDSASLDLGALFGDDTSTTGTQIQNQPGQNSQTSGSDNGSGSANTTSSGNTQSTAQAGESTSSNSATNDESANESNSPTNARGQFAETEVLMFEDQQASGTIKVTQAGETLTATINREAGTQAAMPNLTEVRYTQFEYQADNSQTEVISVGISTENTLIIMVPDAIKATMDERHIVLLAIAIAKRDLDVDIDNVSSVIMNIGSEL